MNRPQPRRSWVTVEAIIAAVIFVVTVTLFVKYYRE